jgi:hypothetical protein
MRKREITMPNEKLLTVLRGLSPAALRAVIEELARLGPHAGPSREDAAASMPRVSRRSR